MFKRYIKEPIQAYASTAWARSRNVFDDSTLGLIATICMIAVIAFVFICIISVIPWIVGWALMSIIGIFTTVLVTGYWATAGIGLATIILVKVIA